MRITRGIIPLALCLPLGALAAQTPAAPPPDRSSYAFMRDSAFARPVNRGCIAFTIPQKDLFAENVAWSPRDSAFYIGSTRHGNVLRRTRDGRITEFIPSGRDGMWMVIGMKADARRNALWVNSSGGSNYVRHRAEDAGKAGLFRYDLRTGRLVRRWLPADTGRHFFNDLVIAPNGDVIVTDMFAGALYRLAGDGELRQWVPAGTFSFPNGIALSGDGRWAYVTSREGLSQVATSSGAVTRLTWPDSVDVLGSDGLYWHRGSLIGVQGGRRNRVVRYVLDSLGSTVVRMETLEANHPMFMNPTTGVVVGDELFVVANSQFSSFAREGEPYAAERLFETVVLRIPLR